MQSNWKKEILLHFCNVICRWNTFENILYNTAACALIRFTFRRRTASVADRKHSDTRQNAKRDRSAGRIWTVTICGPLGPICGSVARVRVSVRVADRCIQTAGESGKMRINHVIEIIVQWRRPAALRILWCPAFATATDIVLCGRHCPLVQLNHQPPHSSALLRHSELTDSITIITASCCSSGGGGGLPNWRWMTQC